MHNGGIPHNAGGYKKEELEVMVDGEWTKFGVCDYNPSPSTDGKMVEAELVYFDGHTDSQREDWSYLKGKAVLHNGNMIAKDHYKRLMEAKPAFLLMVDTRYTNSECIANGMSTTSIEKYGAVPIVNIAFMDAVKICAHKSTKARLTIEGGAKPSTSQNVVAQFPGTDKDAGVLYFGAQGDVGSTHVNPTGGDMNDTEISFDNEMKSPGMARFVGRALAGTILQVYDKVECVDDLKILKKTVTVPSNMPKPEDMPQARLYKQLHEEGRDSEVPYTAMELTTVVAEAIRMCNLEHGPESFDITLTGLKIGPVAFVGIPGEPFTDIGVAESIIQCGKEVLNELSK